MAKKINVKELLLNNAIIIILIVLALYVGITKDNFLSINNIKNISINTSARFILALGVSGCLITKGTDLSAGRVAGLSACIAGTLLQKADYSGKFFPNLGEFSIVGTLLICIAIGCMFGLLNGLVISFLKVPPFLATLGVQTIAYSAALIYTKAEPLGGYTKAYTNTSTGLIGGVIPYPVIYAILIGALVWFIYNKTRHGKYMYALGGNESAAEVSGVNINKTKIIIYTFAAALYALAGFLLGAKAGGAGVNMAQGYELEAIAACTIGGVSTNGGVGRVSGILIGVLVFEILKSSMQFLGINSSWQYMVQGFVIIIAVALDIRKYIAKK